MAEAVQQIPTQTPQIPQSILQLLAKGGHAYIVGRCVSAKRAGTLFSHLIVMPAPDPYSSPSTVEVIAKTRQADSEQDVRLFCRVGGYKRSYKKTDQDTGEQRQVQTADNKLFLVED
jgi:hypothetical protein